MSEALYLHVQPAYSVAFSPDGSTIASCGKDQKVKLFDVATGDTRKTFDHHTASVNVVKFDPRGRWLASAADDKKVALVDVESGAVKHIVQHGSNVLGLAFRPDGKQLATGANKFVNVFDLG